jgi:hypothetical protein
VADASTGAWAGVEGRVTGGVVLRSEIIFENRLLMPGGADSGWRYPTRFD